MKASVSFPSSGTIGFANETVKNAANDDDNNKIQRIFIVTIGSKKFLLQSPVKFHFFADLVV